MTHLTDALLDCLGEDLEGVLDRIKQYRDGRNERERLRKLARTSDFDHITGDRPCNIVTLNFPIGFLAKCVTHNVESERHWSSAVEARQDFLCDAGRRWNFIFHHRDDVQRPRMLDLTGLWDEVPSLVQNGGVLPSTGETDLVALYRYVDDDVRIPLQITAHQLPREDQLAIEAPVEGTEVPTTWPGRLVVRGAKTDRFLVVVHAVDEEPNLFLQSLPYSAEDPEATSA